MRQPPDPTLTHDLFRHDRVGAGYASARPFLHPEAFARVREMLRLEAPVGRALDVGCGTGMSSVALLGLSREVVGIDASVAMLRHGREAAGVRYVASTAESLPFRGGPFDLVAACGAIDWVDRETFLPRVAELLVSGGFLVSLDFGHAGRSADVAGLEAWYQGSFQRVYPSPPTLDPILTAEDGGRHGFSPPIEATLDFAWTCTASQYADFLLTESSVVAAIEYGTARVEEIREWLLPRLLSLFGHGAREIAFGGYVQALRRL